VDLPLAGAILDDKRVGQEFTGRVRRLSSRALEAVVDVELVVLANVRLRLTDPGTGRASGDLYGKVTGVATQDRARVVRIHLTSVDATDQAILARLRERASEPGSRDVVSKSVEASR
jgi:hypothetical protein